jgi:hypothetical protein
MGRRKAFLQLSLLRLNVPTSFGGGVFIQWAIQAVTTDSKKKQFERHIQNFADFKNAAK